MATTTTKNGSSLTATWLARVGVILMLAGWCCAAVVWVRQDRLERAAAESGTTTAADSGSPLDSKKGVRQLETDYGKSGLVIEEGTEWADSLRHGKKLAWTIAVGSILLCGACYGTALFLLVMAHGTPQEIKAGGRHGGEPGGESDGKG